MRRHAITIVSLALLAAPVAATPAVAGEAERRSSGQPTVLARGLLSPLSLAVTPRGGVWFSQNFSGQLMSVRPGGAPRLRYTSRRGAEVGAISLHRGVVTFATTSQDGRRTTLLKRTRSGRVVEAANLSRHERQQNPDAGVVYGIENPSPACEASWPTEEAGPPSYPGIVESHPYATLAHHGWTYIADAAANAILRARRGIVQTVAVLPPQPATITAEAAQSSGLPEECVGEEYNFEPVPTDVERHGRMLYVTTLPGGPEDPSLGRRGAIHRVDPRTGEVETMVTGLLSPTGLAVAGDGDMYVAELFGNRISKVASGETTARRWARSSMPGDVEFRLGRVWATRRVLTGLSGEPTDLPKGQVLRYRR